MTPFERTGVNLYAEGPFTRMDTDLMTEEERSERAAWVRDRIARLQGIVEEFEDELGFLTLDRDSVAGEDAG